MLKISEVVKSNIWTDGKGVGKAKLNRCIKFLEGWGDKVGKAE